MLLPQLKKIVFYNMSVCISIDSLWDKTAVLISTKFGKFVSTRLGINVQEILVENFENKSTILPCKTS